MTQGFVDHTSWIPVAEAKVIIDEFIKNGTYLKEQIKKSSNLFANRKNKDDGYICRVLVMEGIHPELELPKTELPKKAKRVKKSKSAPTPVEVEIVDDQEEDNTRWIVTAELINKTQGLFLVAQGRKRWVERQTIGTNKKEIISPTVTNLDEAKRLWYESLEACAS